MWTRGWWLDAGERAAATAAETLLAALGVAGVVGSLDAGPLLAADWPGVLLVSAAAGGLSLVKSVIAGARSGTASLVSSGRHAKPEA